MVSERGMYSIGALSRMLGVSATTLRSWEERYGVVVPDRSPGAQRLYSRDHLEQLLFVCEQMERGLSAADAHRVLAERLGTAAPLTPETPETPGADAPRIVLVDRDPYATELAEYFLRTEGYEVAVARDATAGEQLAVDRAPDLAVVDLMIDGGSGLRLCERLRNVVPVLAVSAIDQRDRALDAGADAFVLKPVEALTLVSAVRDILRTSAIVRRASRMPLG